MTLAHQNSNAGATGRDNKRPALRGFVPLLIVCLCTLGGCAYDIGLEVGYDKLKVGVTLNHHEDAPLPAAKGLAK